MALKQITAQDFKEAVDSLNNGSTCWRKILGRTEEGTELCFVVGWSDAGYDEDDAKKNGYFDDGYTICSKIACQSRYNGSQSDFDGDFTMPYDKETGDVWDTSTMVSNNESDWDSDAKSYNEDAQAMWDTYCVSGDDGLTALDAMVESKQNPESKQSKGCSMKRKIESLAKKKPAAKKNESVYGTVRVDSEDIAIKVQEVNTYKSTSGASLTAEVPEVESWFSTLSEFSDCVSGLAENCNGYADISRDGSDILVEINAPKDDESGDYEVIVEIRCSTEITHDSLDGVVDLLNDA